MEQSEVKLEPEPEVKSEHEIKPVPETKMSPVDKAKFERDSILYGYGLCLTCGVNAGPLCTPCFAATRRRSSITKLHLELETIVETE